MIYLHVPFCRSFCTYCGFYSEIPGKGDCGCEGTAFSGFCSAVCSEIHYRREEISRDVNTLYVGGGTPSVLPLSVLSRIVGTLKECGASCFSEFTVEANPEDIVTRGPEYVAGLVSIGVNRVSMGIQSFDDRILGWMNRRHNSRTAVEACSILREGGIGNVSIDLIFGMGEAGQGYQSDAHWEQTVEKALSACGGIPPEHISAYQLSVEDGSALAGMYESGRWSPAPDAECSREYDYLCARLADAGYRHYEISNFALPGYEAVHNSAYWRHVPYTGFGPGAHSFSINGSEYVRRWNAPDLSAYLSAAESGDWEKASGHEILSGEQIMIEKIMLSLRTDNGISRDLLESYVPHERLSMMETEGLLVPAPAGCLRIPEDRFFISDSIIASLV